MFLFQNRHLNIFYGKEFSIYVLMLTHHIVIHFRAGMLPGDVVVEINGVKVNTAEEIYQAVRSSDQITMVVQRGRELLRLQMTPEYTE